MRLCQESSIRTRLVWCLHKRSVISAGSWEQLDYKVEERVEGYDVFIVRKHCLLQRDVMT